MLSKVYSKELVELESEFSAFSDGEINLSYEDEDDLSNPIEIKDNLLREVIDLKNKGKIICFEKIYTISEKYISGGIKVVRLGKDNKVIWTSIILRKQKSSYLSKLPYIFHESKNKLYFLFNDIRAGCNDAGSPIKSNYKDVNFYRTGALSLAVVDKHSGEARKVLLKDNSTPVGASVNNLKNRLYYSDKKNGYLYFTLQPKSLGSSVRFFKIWLP